MAARFDSSLRLLRTLPLALAACATPTTAHTSTSTTNARAEAARAPTEAPPTSTCGAEDVSACVDEARGADPVVARAAVATLQHLCPRGGRLGCDELRTLYRDETLLLPPEAELPAAEAPTVASFEDEDQGFYVSLSGFPAIRYDGAEVVHYDNGDIGGFDQGAESISFSAAPWRPTGATAFPQSDQDDEDYDEAAVRQAAERARERLAEGEFRSLFPATRVGEGLASDSASPVVLVWWLDAEDPALAHYWVRRRGPGAILARGQLRVTLGAEPCDEVIDLVFAEFDPPTRTVVLHHALGPRERRDECDADAEYSVRSELRPGAND